MRAEGLAVTNVAERAPRAGAQTPQGSHAKHRKTGPGAAIDRRATLPMAAQDGPAGPAAPVLPDPPDNREKYSYIRRHTWVLTVCSLASFPLLLFSQVQMMGNYSWFWFYAPFVAFGALFFMLPLLTDGFSRGFDLDKHRGLVETWRPLRYPSVDVFLPVCGEPVEVLRNTWTHVTLMARHYRGPVSVYVLDDSGNTRLKAMARSFGFAYATRPYRGWLKKSGNLLYGFKVSSGEFILLLDADFAPRRDLLDETLPYLAAYPDAGIVQTPQFFRVLDRQTWVERGAGAVQELFYRSIQTARASRGGAICVGSCAIYRRAALLHNDGMSLAEHSEDVRTGFDLQRLGWRLLYLPIALSTGNCPDNILAFLNQQYRWCSGTVGLLSDRVFWRTRLPFYTRMCYISGFVYYLYTAVFNFAVPALTIVMLIAVPNVFQLKNMLLILPVLVYAGVIYPAWHHSPYRLEAWSVKVISGWAHVFTYWDSVRGTRRGWQPSGTGRSKQDGRRRFWAGLIGWSATSSALWAGLAFWRMVTGNPYNFILVFVLGVFEVVIISRILIQPGGGATS
jgi:cellulose synthase/poly-beta-1,6-N-acetylglucosamine synthase-like glycosyltransferase